MKARSWSRWLTGKAPKSPRRPSGPGCRTRALLLEPLEDRTVPSVVFDRRFGAETVPQATAYAMLNNSPAVWLIFWGQSWTAAQVNSLTTAAGNVLNSAYMPGVLAAYGGNGRPTLGAQSWTDVKNPPSGFNPGNLAISTNYQAVQTEIGNAIGTKGSGIPAPGNITSILQAPIYVVITAADVSAGTNGGYNAAGVYNSVPINMVSLGTGGGTTDTFSQAFNHEVAERITDPGSSGGVTVTYSTDGTFPAFVNTTAPNVNNNPAQAGNQPYLNNGGQIGDGEQEPAGQQHYAYRLNNGTKVQSFWSANAHDANFVLHASTIAGAFVVPDGNTESIYLDPIWTNGSITVPNTNPAVTVNGLVFSGNYNLVIIGDHQASQAANDSITVNASDSLVTVALDGQNFSLDNGGPGFGQIKDIKIEAGGGTNTINIQALATDQTLEVSGTGTDNITLGNNKDLSLVLGPILITNSGPNTSLNIDDSNDGQSIGRIVTLSAGDGLSVLPSVRFATLTTVRFGQNTLSALTITGDGFGNTFNVGTAALFTTTLNTGAGNDQVNVTDTLGPLLVNGVDGRDTVICGNGTDGVQEISGAVTVTNPGRSGLSTLIVDDSAGTIGKPNSAITGQPAVMISSGAITGLAPAAINYHQFELASLTINGSAFGNTFAVASTPVNDQDLTANSLVTTLNDGAGNDTVTVLGTEGPLIVQGVNGIDKVTIGNPVNGVQSINGDVTVENAAERGFMNLTVDESADSVGQPDLSKGQSAVMISDSGITGLAPAAINFFATDLNGLTINGGSGGNNFTVVNTGTFFTTTIQPGAGNNTVTVLGTAGALNIFGNGPGDTVNVGNGTVQDIFGDVTIMDPKGFDTITVNDSIDGTAHTNVTIDSGRISGLSQGNINYTQNDVDTLTILGGIAVNTYNVIGTPFNGDHPLFVTLNTGVEPDVVNVRNTSSPFTINSVGGSNTFNIGNTRNNLDDIQATVTLNGSGTDKVNINDQGAISGQTYGFTSNSLSRSGAATIAFANLRTLTLNASTFSDTVTLSAIPINTLAAIIKGDGGSDTLIGNNAVNTWNLTGANAGNVGNVMFSAIPNLVGGTSTDTFKFSSGASFASINGGGGGDWLDYSSLSSLNPVTVNLATGSATRVAGGAVGAISNIQNVRGGAGNDSLTGNTLGNILEGGAGNDVLVGGSGRSLLIGGTGTDTVTGGSGDDILIGSTTTYDLDQTTLSLLLKEWQRTDIPYLQRIADLRNDGGANGGYKLLWGTTVHDDAGATDSLTGGAGLDWFFQFPGDTITDLNNGGPEIVETKPPPLGSFVSAHSFGSAGNDAAVTVATDTAGNVYVTGFFQGTVAFGATNLTAGGDYDGYVAKYSSTGALLWVRQFGGSNPATDLLSPFGVAVDGAGSVYVSGYFFGSDSVGSFTFNSGGAFVSEAFIAKLDGNGTVVWAKALGSSQGDIGYSLALDGAGNLYLAGAFQGTATFGSTTLTSAGNNDGFVAKLDNAGTVVWARRMGGSSDDQVFDIAVDNSGNVYIAGTFSSSTASFGSTTLTNAGNYDVFVTKLSSAGTFLWTRGQGGSMDDEPGDIKVDRTGNVYVTGFLGGDPVSFTGGNVFIFKYNTSGTLQWSRTSSGNGDESGTGLALDNSGNLYVTGYFSGTMTFQNVTFTSTGGENPVLFKLNSNGIMLWSKQFGGGGTDIPLVALAVDASNNIFVAGTFQGTSNFDPGGLGNFPLTSVGGNDAFVMQLSQPGPFSFTGLTGSSSAGYALRLNQGYLQVVDSATNTVLASKALVDASAVSITGAAGVNTTLTIDFSGGAFAVPITFTGNSSNDTLVGPNATNTWTISGANSGRVGNITFTRVENLVGGAGVDTFKFSPSGSVVSINGGAGGDWLDYSAVTTGVTVNLATGSATAVGGGAAGALSNIQNVTGGAGNDVLIGNAQGNILIGGAGNDTLTGGSGRSLLIGGLGSDTIIGGLSGNIVIGGTTTFDTNHAALMSILAEWQSRDSYATRLLDLRNGGGLNGSNRLIWATTVLDDGAADVLTGGPGLDWFFANLGPAGVIDTITDRNNGGIEQVN
jgi:hypothetical protein